jgi:hypothetical protein
MTQATQTLEFGGSSMAPLDAAAEYLRTRLDAVLPLYVLAMAPHAAVTLLLIEAIAVKHGGQLQVLCIELLAATIWRWIWLARIQANVQAELSGKRGSGFWRKLLPMIVIRLFSGVAITWGSFLILPAFVGLFTGSFAAPLLLESDEPAHTRIFNATGWIMRASKRLFRVTMAMSLLGLVLAIACFVTQFYLVREILPLFGFQSTSLDLTLGSTTWRLGMCYFVFLILDLYWTVLSVVLYDDSRSQRMATDLYARLAVITGGAA